MTPDLSYYWEERERSARIINGMKKNNVAKVYYYHTQHPHPFFRDFFLSFVHSPLGKNC